MVKEATTSLQLELNTSIYISKGIFEHHWEEKCKENRGHDTTLFSAVCNIEEIRQLPVRYDSSFHSLVEGNDDIQRFVRYAELL